VAALVVAIAALAVAMVAASISVRQLGEAKKANAFPATVDLFREYRSVEMVKARRLLFHGLADADPTGGIRGMPDDLARAALRVSHYLDNLGVLVAHRLIDPRLAAGFLGDSTLRLWKDLAPFIYSEREFRNPNAYLQYFEHLACTLREVQPMRVREELSVWGPDE